MSTIICLFSVDNNYDQPSNNLVAWWSKKPSFETLLAAIGGTMKSEPAILAAANLVQNLAATHNDTGYRLEIVAEGKLL